MDRILRVGVSESGETFAHFFSPRPALAALAAAHLCPEQESMSLVGFASRVWMGNRALPVQAVTAPSPMSSSSKTFDSDVFVDSLLATHAQDFFGCLAHPESLLEIKQRYGIPSLDAVLADESRLEPWEAFVFLEFLQVEFSEESFYFYQEVEAYKAKLGLAKKRPKNVLLLLSEKCRNDDVEWARAMKSEFVVNSAPHEINISYAQRSSLIDALDADVTSGRVRLETFLDAQNELKTHGRALCCTCPRPTSTPRSGVFASQCPSWLSVSIFRSSV